MRIFDLLLCGVFLEAQYQHSLIAIPKLEISDAISENKIYLRTSLVEIHSQHIYLEDHSVRAAYPVAR